MTPLKSSKEEVKKSKTKTKQPDKVPDLRSMFKNISADEQQAIINFFNLHNAAIWIYNKLSAPAMEYVELSIKFSQEQIKQ